MKLFYFKNLNNSETAVTYVGDNSAEGGSFILKPGQQTLVTNDNTHNNYELLRLPTNDSNINLSSLKYEVSLYFKEVVGAITGKVIDITSLAPVIGATVKIYTEPVNGNSFGDPIKTVITDDNGEFIAPMNILANYVISVYKDNYVPSHYDQVDIIQKLSFASAPSVTAGFIIANADVFENATKYAIIDDATANDVYVKLQKNIFNANEELYYYASAAPAPSDSGTSIGVATAVDIIRSNSDGYNVATSIDITTNVYSNIEIKITKN